MTTVANILTNVGYRVFYDGTSISSTTHPSQAECIAWINEAIRRLEVLCARYDSDINRTLGEITAADGTASYNDFAADFLAPATVRTEEGIECNGWIEGTYTRTPIMLAMEAQRTLYSPSSSAEGEPEKFYVDGSDNIVFLPTPDDTYTVKIPYYTVNSAMTLTTSTIPFGANFDDIIVEYVVMRHQLRDEYDIRVEASFMESLQKQARDIILMRKGHFARVVS